MADGPRVDTVRLRDMVYAHRQSAVLLAALELGDFTRDALPASADVAIMASNLPQYGSELWREVVARVYTALEPGGEMHLIGEMLRPAKDGPPGPALWGLAEALDHSTGVAHSRGRRVPGVGRLPGRDRERVRARIADARDRTEGGAPAGRPGSPSLSPPRPCAAPVPRGRVHRCRWAPVEDMAERRPECRPSTDSSRWTGGS